MSYVVTLSYSASVSSGERVIRNILQLTINPPGGGCIVQRVFNGIEQAVNYLRKILLFHCCFSSQNS